VPAADRPLPADYRLGLPADLCSRVMPHPAGRAVPRGVERIDMPEICGFHDVTRCRRGREPGRPEACDSFSADPF